MTAAQSLISEGLRAQLEADYRHLHAHPELSMQEHRTAAYIEARLSELDIEHFRCGGTGVVGVLRNGDGPTVAYRADTDALPIAEETGLEWSSEATGRLPDGTEVPVMHGCGHDTHVAVALALTRVLAEQRDAWSGTVVMVFQPGEEVAAGAAAMVADGLWDRAPRPEAVYGQHVMPHLTGTIALPVGTAMAIRHPFNSPSYSITVPSAGRNSNVIAVSSTAAESAQVAINAADYSPSVATNRPMTVGLRFSFDYE